MTLPLGWPEPDPAGRPLVKICGLSDPRIAAAAVEAGAEFIGVVHFEPSPRHVGAAVAREVADAVSGGAMVVLLSVDASDRELDALMERVAPAALQLHGREPPERVAALIERYDLPVAKALGIGGPDDLAAASDYPEALLLLDAKPPADSDRPGGHGAPFDWRMLDALDPPRPFMLSGGLDPHNVSAAVRTARPYAVDVSSGVEVGGRKDRAAVEAFIAAARARTTEA